MVQCVTQKEWYIECGRNKKGMIHCYKPYNFVVTSNYHYDQRRRDETTNTSIREEYLYLKQRVCFCIDRLVNEVSCID